MLKLTLTMGVHLLLFFQFVFMLLACFYVFVFAPARMSDCYIDLCVFKCVSVCLSLFLTLSLSLFLSLICLYLWVPWHNRLWSCAEQFSRKWRWPHRPRTSTPRCTSSWPRGCWERSFGRTTVGRPRRLWRRPQTGVRARVCHLGVDRWSNPPPQNSQILVAVPKIQFHI